MDDEELMRIRLNTGWFGHLTHRQVSTILASLAVWRAMKSEPLMSDDEDFSDLSTNGGLHSEMSIAEIDDLSDMLSGAVDD